MRDGHPIRWHKKDAEGNSSVQGKKVQIEMVKLTKVGPEWQEIIYACSAGKIRSPRSVRLSNNRNNKVHLEDSVWKVNLTENGGRTFGTDLLYLLYFTYTG